MDKPRAFVARERDFGARGRGALGINEDLQIKGIGTCSI
jgi:hypothetical protein